MAGISIEFSIQFVKDTDGHTKWVVAVIRDVTERYLREKAQRSQMSAARQDATTEYREAPNPG